MTDLKTEIRKQLLDGEPWGEKNDIWPFEGLERQLKTANPSKRAELVAACQALITDTDLQVRTGIVAILSTIAQDVGAEWIYSQLINHPELFVQVAPSGAKLRRPTLEKEILVAMARVVKANEVNIIARLREEAQILNWGSSILHTLAKVDSDWLVAHAAEVVPHEVVSVLLPLSTEQRRQLIAALAPWPPEVLANISSAFWKQFPPEEAKTLYKLMIGDFGD